MYTCKHFREIIWLSNERQNRLVGGGLVRVGVQLMAYQRAMGNTSPQSLAK